MQFIPSRQATTTRRSQTWTRRCLAAALVARLMWVPALARTSPPPEDVSSRSASTPIQITRSVPFVRRGERELLADLYRPRGAAEPSAADAPLPAIVMVHGGAWFAGDKVQVTGHARYAARRGYFVMSINYRLAPRHKFPAQLEDCRAALRWLVQHADRLHVDRDRIGAYGYSAGAQLACLLGISDHADDTPNNADVGGPPPATARVKAVVAGGTPCDFHWIPDDSRALAYWLGGSRAEKPDLYRMASPLAHVDSQDPPVFLFHGQADRIVPVETARRMHASLTASKVPTRLMVVQGANHMATFLAREPRRQAMDFLDQVLRLEPEDRRPKILESKAE